MKSNDLKNDYLLIISRALISLILFFGASVAGALNEGSQTYTLDGILYQKGTTTPLLDSAALLKIQIISPDGNCLLYEESQTVDTSTTKGYFNIQVGSALANTKRTVNDPGLTMAQIFQNTLAVSATSVPSRTCSGNSYTPSAGQSRYFRITVTPSLTTVADVLTPDIVLDSVPQAIVAQSIQGLERADLLHRSTAVGVSLDQTNLEALFTGSSYTNLQSILSGNFMRVGTSGATLPSYASTPSGVSAGQMWYDSTTNQVKYQSNSGVQTIGTSSGGISSLTVAAALSVNGTVAGTVSSGTVTLDLANTGVSTGTYALVTVDTKGRVTAGAVSLTEAELPVISTVGKVSGNAITSGTISGSTSMVTTGNLLTSGVVSGTTVNATTVVAGTISGSTVQGTTLSGSTVQASNLRIYNGIQYVQFTAQAMSSSYSMALPTADGISGQVMATNGSGILSWITPSSGIAGTISIGQGGTAATSFSASRIIASNSTGTAMVSFGCALNEVISFDVSGMAQCSSIGSIAGSGLIANGGNTTGAAVSIGTNDNYALQLKASNAVAMTISTNGNVGIGTESPSAKFDINNSAVNTTSAILARGVNDSNFQFLVKSGSSGSAAGTVQGVIGLDYPAGSNYDIAAIKFLRGGGAADGSLAFYTYNNERVRIDASGNLGIGTTSPATALDVSGVLTARGLSSAPSVAASNTGRIYYDYSTNKFKVSQNSEAYVDLIPAGGAGDLLNGGNTTGLAVTVGTNDAQPLNLEVNNTTAMTISQSGNVGIGTTNPGYSLDIKGNTGSGAVMQIDGTNQVGGARWQFLSTSGGASQGQGKFVLRNSSGPDVMTVTGVGNVGFGTTGPTSILHTVASGAKTAAYTGNYLSNTATSSTASINKIGLDVQSTGSWTGASAVNTGLNVTVSGGTTNYSATFQGGNVGIGTTAPTELLDVNGGIRLGTTSGSNAGTIRWDGTNFSGYNGSAWVNFVPDPPASGACDTVSTYSTAGTYAYTVPASFGTITVRLWGAGGGGGGSHSSGAGTTGATGGNSTISSLGLFASGGSGGAPGSNTPVLGTGGAGGAAAGGATNTTGNAGSAATSSGSGAGGTAPNGGAGGASQGSATTSGLAGSSPGGGGSGARSSSTIAGGGAGSGGYVEKTFTSATLNPGTAISDIVVGASGAGGSGANSGGAGGTGRVSITCASAGAPVTNDRGVLFMNGGTYSTATNFVYDSSGRVGVGTSTPTVSLDMGSNTDGIRMPSGTTAQQITCNSGAAGTMRYNTQTTFMEYCDGSSWNALPKIQPASPPTTPSGGGYFVVTQSTYTGNLGGLAGANAACLTELTTYTNWAGYADANSRGLLNSSKVKAYLCDNSSCNQGVPLATYAYGAVGFPGVGGGTMTVDSSGYGPNDSTSWAAANRFGSAYLIWTGRYSTSATAWSGAAAGFNCSSWSTAGAGSNGEIGYASNTDKTRWYGGISTCDIPRNLVCFVNP